MMFRKSFAATGLFLALGIALSANAVEVRAYEEFKKQTPEQALAYLTGVGEGFSWANAALASHGDHPLYCVPNSLSLNADNYSKLLESELASSIKEKPGIDNGSKQIELVLYVALVKAFPCPQ